MVEGGEMGAGVGGRLKCLQNVKWGGVGDIKKYGKLGGIPNNIMGLVCDHVWLT